MLYFGDNEWVLLPKVLPLPSTPSWLKCGEEGTDLHPFVRCGARISVPLGEATHQLKFILRYKCPMLDFPGIGFHSGEQDGIGYLPSVFEENKVSKNKV